MATLKIQNQELSKNGYYCNVFLKNHLIFLQKRIIYFTIFLFCERYYKCSTRPNHPYNYLAKVIDHKKNHLTAFAQPNNREISNKMCY